MIPRHATRSALFQAGCRSLLWFMLCCCGDAWSAPVVGWQRDTSFGNGSTVALSGANTNSPILGDGTSNNADNVAIYAGFPTIALANGERITLSGSAQFIGSSSNGDFRWGLYKDDEVGAVTGGWLGYMASAESLVWSKDPDGSNFANATFASTASGRGAVLGHADEPNELPFSPGMYSFELSVERYGNEVDVRMSITNPTTGFSIVSLPLTESAPPRLTFEFDRVGFLAGSILNANQVRFGNVQVATTPIDAPRLEVHSSGLAFLANTTGQSLEFIHYEILSNSHSLNPDGWKSLDSRENEDPVGVGWDEAGGNNEGVLAEVNLLGKESLLPGARLDLGHPFEVAGTHDLALRLTSPEGVVQRGVVQYVQSGDYNRDGKVDASDYVEWRRSLGSQVPFGSGADGNGDGLIEQADYDVWRVNFGASPAAEPGSAFAVPEPATLGTALLIVLALRRPGTLLILR